MRLTPEQQAELRERGIVANEACDTCGKILGAVRYTRRGELGEWCSETCRDGSAAVEGRQARRAGRPRKYQSEHQRKEAKRVQAATRQRAFRSRLSVTQNTPAAA